MDGNIFRLVDDPEAKAFSEKLAEVENFMAYDNDKAFELVEKLLEEYADKRKEYVNDDEIEYYSFSEPIERELYILYSHTDKKIRRISMDFANLYGFYGTLLLDKERIEEAVEAFTESLRWNPAGVRVLFELATTYQMRDEPEEYLRINKEAYKYITKREHMGRFFRSVGFYFVKKMDFENAMGAFLYSWSFEKSRVAAEKVNQLKSIVGEDYHLDMKKWEETLKEYGISIHPSEKMMSLAYGGGKVAYENGDMFSTAYYWGIFRQFAQLDEVETVMKKLHEDSQKILK